MQNSERRLLKQWAEDTKQELSLANKELTAVSFLLDYYIIQIKDKVYSQRKEEKTCNLAAAYKPCAQLLRGQLVLIQWTVYILQ